MYLLLIWLLLRLPLDWFSLGMEMSGSGFLVSGVVGSLVDSWSDSVFIGSGFVSSI